MRERYYPPAYDRTAEKIESLEIQAAAHAVYLEGVQSGMELLMQGMTTGFNAMKACDVQIEDDCSNIALAQDHAEEAMDVHPGKNAPDTKAGEAYRYIADGFNALDAEYSRASGIQEEYFFNSGRELKSKALIALVAYEAVKQALGGAQSALASWRMAGQKNREVIEQRTAETVVLDDAKQNIANAKEQLQPAAVESTTDAESVTPATATAKLREAKEDLLPLAERIQNIRTRVGKLLTEYEEAGRILMNWNPEADGPMPAALLEKHASMGLLIQEINLVLTAQVAEQQAAEVNASYEAMDTVTAIVAESQSMRERAISHLDASDSATETYIQRGYDV